MTSEIFCSDFDIFFILPEIVAQHAHSNFSYVQTEYRRDQGFMIGLYMVKARLRTTVSRNCCKNDMDPCVYFPAARLRRLSSLLLVHKDVFRVVAAL